MYKNFGCKKLDKMGINSEKHGKTLENGAEKLDKTVRGRLTTMFDNPHKRYEVVGLEKLNVEEGFLGPVLYGFEGLDDLPEGDFDVVVGGSDVDVMLCKRLNRLGYGRKLAIYAPMYYLGRDLIKKHRPARIYVGRGYGWYVWVSGWNKGTEVKWLGIR